MFPLLIFLSFSFILQITITQTKINLTSQSPSIVVIPFKTNFPNSKKNTNKNGISALEYFENIHSSRIYLQLESTNNIKNNKPQYLNIFTKTDESIFYLDDYYSQIDNLLCPYSSQLSPSYHFCYNTSHGYEEYNLDKSICAKDDFKLYKDYSLKEYDTIKIEFQHYIDKIANISFACGKTGLKLPSYNTNKKGNFITQIHEKMPDIDISFTFKYSNKDNKKNLNDLDEGLFIIGIQSYEKKNKVELNSIYVSQINFNKMEGWRFDIFIIYIGNNYFDFDDLDIEINPDIDGIEITEDFYLKLNEYFFQDYYDKGICISEKIKHEWNIIIYCKPDKFKESDINKFPDINFLKYQIRFNFTLTGKELFHQIGDKIFFKMVVNTEIYKKNIIFGKLFMKKYQVIFNSDYKSLSFYKENNNLLENDKDISKMAFDSNKKKESILTAILHIFIGLIILIIGIFFGKKFCHIKRRIYANELEDSNYIYESKEKKNDNNKENMLIDV